MKYLMITFIWALSVPFSSSSSSSSDNSIVHNVWAHNSFVNCDATIQFYHQAGEVYNLLERMKRVYQDANSNLEYGVIAEFESKRKSKDHSHKLQPEKFELTLSGYIELRKLMDNFDKQIQKLETLNNKNERVKKWDNTLRDIMLNERTRYPRLATIGARYSDVGGLKNKTKTKNIDGITSILSVWRIDLEILKSTLDEVIVGLRDAIPLAEKGEFAAVMLSGRNAFGDKNPQFTDMFSTYQQMYVQTVLATISATMQSYPAGYNWLTDGC